MPCTFGFRNFSMAPIWAAGNIFVRHLSPANGVLWFSSNVSTAPERMLDQASWEDAGLMQAQTGTSERPAGLGL